MRKDCIFVEESKIIDHQHYDDDIGILRLESLKCSESALPGSFIHLKCNEELLMRRPFSIMKTKKGEWIEVLYKSLGLGTQALENLKKGDQVNFMGPIGKGFEIVEEKRTPVLIGGGIGIPPLIFLLDEIKKNKSMKPFVFFGSETKLPFKYSPSKILIKGLPSHIIASVDFIEANNIPSRLSSTKDFPGFHQGYIHELVEIWLKSLDKNKIEELSIFSCGPKPMLREISYLAKQYNIPCQISVEEHMACAVGGCAGCIIKVKENERISAKRVCVDGPVFDAATIYYE